ncbi:MAG TPA: TIGR03621 family F420-dependent LLM class oxidoreductase [Pseudonocardiaceae bacterium]|jgi:probable F420-dependent oxidoreductase|nr:TIGR03621 family F420-dependent LLM class oxidoreductase [Pseudonocardiaceae bacterium]
MRRFRFGVQLSAATDLRTWRDTVARIADLGYSTVVVPDHLGRQWAPMVALAAALDAAPGLTLGTLVINTVQRNPVVLAKEAATLDLLSAGRFELGLGAGWLGSDAVRSGVAMAPAGERVERLTEWVDILELFWSKEIFSYHGRYYDLTDVVAMPRPARERPKLLIGGGSRRVLSLAGRRADVAALDVALPAGRFTSSSYVDAADAALFRQRAGWVAAAAGTRDADVERQLLVLDGLVAIGRDESAAARVADRWGIGVDRLRHLTTAMVGSVADVSDRLRERRECMGISYYVVQAGAFGAVAPVVDRLAGT